MYILVPRFHIFYWFSLAARCVVSIHYTIFCFTDAYLLSHNVPPDVEVPINLYRTAFISTLVIAVACAHVAEPWNSSLGCPLSMFVYRASSWHDVHTVPSGSAIYPCVRWMFEGSGRRGTRFCHHCVSTPSNQICNMDARVSRCFFSYAEIYSLISGSVNTRGDSDLPANAMDGAETYGEGGS